MRRNCPPALILLLLAAGCGCNGPAVEPPITWPEGDPKALFDSTEILSMGLTVGASAERSLTEHPYRYVPADLTWAGWELPVSIRLKGRGSFRPWSEKPALLIDMNRRHEEGELLGLKKLTLNNMSQDRTAAVEALSYSAFRALDLPAPRTAYLELSINGESRGLYLLVESVDSGFLNRHVGEASGNLYEGGYRPGESGPVFADLDPARIDIYEHDVMGEPTDRADLRAFAQALEAASDDELPDLLRGHLDLDAFYRFCAAEVYLAHWDGYAGNANNHFIYSDGERLRFLPWGTDRAMQHAHRGGPEGFGREHPGLLFQRVAQHPELNAELLDALARVIDELEAADLPEQRNSLLERIDTAVESDPRFAFELHEFEDGHVFLNDFLSTQPETLREQLP